MTTALRLEGIHKSFGANEVLRGIDLELAEHEVVCLIGASGSGKSTLLRCVNLLEVLNAGRVWLGGEEITRRGVDVNAVRRRIGIVFQAFNLFPHMTVLRNVTLAPRDALRLPREEAEARATELLGRFGLADKRDEYPDRLSGGQQQRVAIVRALAMQPELMLLDEVTSALDPALVAEVQRDPRARRGRHDDADRHARDEFCPRHREPGLLPRRGADPRGGATRADLYASARTEDAAVPRANHRGRPSLTVSACKDPVRAAQQTARFPC
jgi:polar amino acid transport system ATP-binding protein